MYVDTPVERLDVLPITGVIGSILPLFPGFRNQEQLGQYLKPKRLLGIFTFQTVQGVPTIDTAPIIGDVVRVIIFQDRNCQYDDTGVFVPPEVSDVLSSPDIFSFVNEEVWGNRFRVIHDEMIEVPQLCVRDQPVASAPLSITSDLNISGMSSVTGSIGGGGGALAAGTGTIAPVAGSVTGSGSVGTTGGITGSGGDVVTYSYNSQNSKVWRCDLDLRRYEPTQFNNIGNTTTTPTSNAWYYLMISQSALCTQGGNFRFYYSQGV